MKRTWLKCMGIAFSICGGIIGVGFASGREVVTFFAGFGYFGLLFCALAGLSFMGLAFIIFNFNQIKNRKNDKYLLKNECFIVKIRQKCDFLKIFLFITQTIICASMFAGFMVIIDKIIYEIHLKVFVFIVIIYIAYFVISNKGDAVHFVNTVLTTVLICMLFIIFILKIINGRYEFLEKTCFVWHAPIMPFLYAGMNIITVTPLVLEESKFLKSNKEKFIASFILGFTIMVVLAVLCILILLFGGDKINNDMIMTDIASSYSVILGYVYSALVLFSIFTTLVTTARGAAVNFCIKKSFKIKSICVLLMALVLSFVGFKKIIDIIYPCLGIVSLVYITVSFCLAHIKVKYKNTKKCKID